MRLLHRLLQFVVDRSTPCSPEDSLKFSSNRVELASQKTAQSAMNSSDRLVTRKFAQYSSGAVDGEPRHYSISR